MTYKTIDIEGIGKVQFRKSKLAKRLNIRIKPIEGVLVSIPKRLSFEAAQKIILQKSDWIKKHLPKVQKLEKNRSNFALDTDFKTRFHQLEIIESKVERPLLKLRAGKMQVFFPQTWDIKSPDLQKFIKQAIEFTLRREAKFYLPKRLAELAKKHNFQFNKVFIKNTKTRWGSCSDKNNINLSLHLMRLPEQLSDYVMLHELCHTIEKNHGKGFWSLLDKVSGDAKGLDKMMRKYHIAIF